MALEVKQDQGQGFLKSNFPVWLPFHPALTLSDSDFEAFLENELKPINRSHIKNDDDSITLVSIRSKASDTAQKDAVANTEEQTECDVSDRAKGHPFMKALTAEKHGSMPDMTNKMLTENADVAHRSTGEALVDLFAELEEVASGTEVDKMLEAAWREDALTTLKLIFNARSIHLGKSSRLTTYRCFGWLAQNHPLTLISNLQWLSRPVIQKKVPKKEGLEDELVFVEAEKDEDDPSRFDVRNGVAHGYWKDLLNVLALAVTDDMADFHNPRSVLNVHDDTKAADRQWDAGLAKKHRADLRDNRHKDAVQAFTERPVYRTLHLTIARLFAAQIKQDLSLLKAADPKARKNISLCAKWAPSNKCFHDKHTFIVSSIAESLHPQSEFPAIDDRELYLRHAREAYRKDVSALRKVLEIVERDISAETFSNIKYDRIPSLAMNKYASLFAAKDTDRFESYIEKVAQGKRKISGATLLPSKLVHAIRARTERRMLASAGVRGGRGARRGRGGSVRGGSARRGSAKGMIEKKMQEMEAKVIDGQWRTLVQRIRDSGTLENSIAVCDVSGSMNYPQLADGTTPMDSSIGLSLLVAEVTKPPFGGAFITFSSQPEVQTVDLSKTLEEKIQDMERAHWQMSTDFVAVFEKLILPMALKHKVKQEDMVKQVFVFSDMQFNAAESGAWQWDSSYERIRRAYDLHGYQMPRLIFWNLAGGRSGTAPKPVTTSNKGTALVSGYSQGMLKVFLDSGSFEDPEAEEEVLETEEEDGTVVVKTVKKETMDPLTTMRKAISHPAYSMLKVMD